jgi:periplasmic protein TonB
MEDNLSWRHALAFLATVSAAWIIWRGTHLILTEPLHAPRTPVIHVSLASPPAPPAPPKIVPKPPQPPKPIVQKQVATRTPIETSPHAIGPPVVNAPVTSQNATPTPPAPPAPAAPAENVSLENTYFANCYAAIQAQKRYPMSKDARLEQPSGTATVAFVLDRSGALLSSEIAQSAGGILDRAALDSVRRAQCPPFPAELWPGASQHAFTINLHFTPQ